MNTKRVTTLLDVANMKMLKLRGVHSSMWGGIRELCIALLEDEEAKTYSIKGGESIGVWNTKGGFGGTFKKAKIVSDEKNEVDWIEQAGKKMEQEINVSPIYPDLLPAYVEVNGEIFRKINNTHPRRFRYLIYFPKSEILEVEFVPNKGALSEFIYSFNKVPEEVINKFDLAENTALFYQDEIYNKYTCVTRNRLTKMETRVK